MLLQELWDEPALAGADFYRRPPERGRGRRVLSAAHRRLRAPARTAIELSLPQPELRGPAELVVHVGGAPLGIVAIPSAGRLQPAEVRARVIEALGLELARAAVREALIGQPAEGPGLRERLAAAAVAASKPGPPEPVRPAAEEGALLLARRSPREFGSSASRRAAFPVGAADELQALAEALREPLTAPAGGRAPARAAYVPELIENGARPARASLRPARRPEPDHPGPGLTSRLPILMYHRVAPHGGRAGARWRVTPEQLDEQLAFLHSEDFRSLPLEDWHEAIARRRPAAGRRVCITFDDAYGDFAEHAWPLLRRHGFEANVFVVTGEAGGWNRWDQALGERLPLLGWDELAVLRDDGVVIGSHTASHRPLAALPPA